MTEASPTDPHWRFTRLWAEAQPAVLGFVRSLVADASQADDIAQETALALYQQLDRYDDQRSFISLALGVARHKVADHWRRVGRKAESLLDGEALAALGAAAERLEPDLERERQALEHCLRELSGRNLAIIDRHYRQGQALPGVAAALNLRVEHVRVLISRIREALRRCVAKRLPEVSA